MKQLEIAQNFGLPFEAVTQTFAILAKRGVGKTYTAAVMIEEMLKAGLPLCVVDPVGVWWGLRAGADGVSPGLPIAVLGGDHGDLPLNEDMGDAVAQMVIEQRVPVVIDLSHFRKAASVRFMTAFAEKLYHSNREALHLVLDEADIFAPQRVDSGHERLLGAMEDIVRRGRARGLGITLITQRPAVLNKNVLTQIEVLVALRTIAPNDRKAIDDWVKEHATPEQRNEFLHSLPSLPIGTAWFWSPGWLEVFTQIQVRKRETFDSSRTPKVGEVVTSPRALADIDLSSLQAHLTASVEQAKEADPRALRQRIQHLEKELQSRPEPVVQRIEVPVIADEQLERLEALANAAISKAEELLAFGRGIMEIIGSAHHKSVPVNNEATRPPFVPVPSPKREPVAAGINEQMGLTSGAVRILQNLARIYPMKMTKVQIANISDFTASGGTFQTYWSNMKRRGFVQEVSDYVEITQVGFDYLGSSPRKTPITSQEMIDMWSAILGSGEWKILNTLISSYPVAMSKQELGTITGYTASGGTFQTYLGALKRNRLIEVSRDGFVRANGSTLLLGAAR